MLDELLTKDTIQIYKQPDLSWQEAIRKAAQPLIENGSIGPEYVNAMIEIANEQGPYFNIGDHIALAHARPEAGSHKISLSLLKTTHDVNLINEDHPVSLWFVLAATDSQSHLEVIQGLMQLLTDNDKLQKLLTATDVTEIQKVINEDIKENKS
ncbi:PTS sugar transporter subunit IIA [Paucilactobacillus kaifaensis]|uniref:PTS sugar transporter subunit IIA n=1 Tax=Paucilactobacillus kaifaensis TaxID=2559921 RepID=UPI0010F99495|nr:PTS sugar transporter subunit IIA [Paucilactobacillus kaifaensis]